MMEDKPRQQRGSQAAARAHSGEDEAVDKTALLLRDPAGDELVGRRVNDRFACAQRETNADEQHHCLGNARGYQRGERSSDAPPHHSQRDHQPRTKAGGEPSRGNLKASVANQKRAEDPTQALVPQTVLGADLQARDGNIRAVEKRDGAKNEKPECEEKSLPGVLFCKHSVIAPEDAGTEAAAARNDTPQDRETSRSVKAVSRLV